jgi:hypothetical protein
MALISCPECQREISDKVKACPYCGYPFTDNDTGPQKVEITDIKIQSSKIKPIIIGALTVGIIVTIAFFVTQNINKNNYISNLRAINEKMLEGAVIAEELTSLTHDVWYNTIFKKSDNKTNLYTIDRLVYSMSKFYYRDFEFNSNFNISLSNLSMDKDIILKTDNLKNIREEVNNLMRLLQNPPTDMVTSYNDLNKLFDIFQTFVELAISPSGNLTTFTNKVNDCDSSFVEYHNKIKLYLP